LHWKESCTADQFHKLTVTELSIKAGTTTSFFLFNEIIVL
jgi:hypothetical protein